MASTDELAAAITAEMDFAKHLQSLDCWPDGAALEELLERYRQVDGTLQRVCRSFDDFLEHKPSRVREVMMGPAALAFMYMRDAERLLERRHVLHLAKASIERLRCELVATAGDAVRMHRMVPR